MLIAGIIVFCVVLLVLAFLAPRLSTYFQKGGDKPLQVGETNVAEKLPGKAGDLACEAVRVLAQGRPQERGQGPRRPFQGPRALATPRAVACRAWPRKTPAPAS